MDGLYEERYNKFIEIVIETYPACVAKKNGTDIIIELMGAKATLYRSGKILIQGKRGEGHDFLFQVKDKVERDVSNMIKTRSHDLQAKLEESLRVNQGLMINNATLVENVTILTRQVGELYAANIALNTEFEKVRSEHSVLTQQVTNLNARLILLEEESTVTQKQNKRYKEEQEKQAFLFQMH